MFFLNKRSNFEKNRTNQVIDPIYYVMFQTFSLKYYCGNYCIEILHFCTKIGITLHQWELIKEFVC